MAQSAGSGEGASSIAKDVIDSDDPKHTLQKMAGSKTTKKGNDEVMMKV